jgi:hypothetical protein
VLTRSGCGFFEKNLPIPSHSWPGKPEYVASLTSPETQNNKGRNIMMAMIPMVPMVAAAGYSLIYLLFGGGIGGAILIFLVAKMLGK